MGVGTEGSRHSLWKKEFCRGQCLAVGEQENSGADAERVHERRNCKETAVGEQGQRVSLIYCGAERVSKFVFG